MDFFFVSQKYFGVIGAPISIMKNIGESLQRRNGKKT